MPAEAHCVHLRLFHIVNYHIARDNQQLGSFPREEVLARYQRGEIKGTDLTWTEGMADWKTVAEVFGPPPAVAATTPPPSQTQPPTPPPFSPTSPATSSTATPAAGAPPKPDNFLIWSILATVLCCLPAGIVAIIYSTQVDSKHNSGDYAGAQAAAKNAKMWTIISASVAAVVILGYVIFMAIMAVAAASQA